MTPSQLREAENPPSLQDGLHIRGRRGAGVGAVSAIQRKQSGFGRDSESRCPPTPGHTRNSPTGVWAHLGQGKGHFTNVHELQASDKHQSGFPRGGHEIKTHFRRDEAKDRRREWGLTAGWCPTENEEAAFQIGKKMARHRDGAPWSWRERGGCWAGGGDLGCPAEHFLAGPAFGVGSHHCSLTAGPPSR